MTTIPNNQIFDLNIIEGLSKHWGATTESLLAIGAQRNGQAWHFPERNAQGEVIGTARRFDNGRKGFVAGGHRGLTLGWPLDPYAGTMAENPVLVVEGPSDTAIGMDLGFVTVGRPSALGGLEHLLALLRGLHVVVIGENDDAGRRGAEKIARGLVRVCASVRVVYPPDCAKDLRAWRNAPAGCTRDELRSAIKAAEPVTPEAPIKPLAWKQFPVEALPEPVRSFVRECAQAMGCDTSFVALPALGVIASCIGNAYRVILKRGWTEPSVLWCCTVGESGSLKSPPFKAVLRRLREAQQRAMDAYKQAMSEFEPERERYEDAKKQWKKNNCVGDPPVAPEPPKLVRYIVSDITVEALGPIIEADPRGLLMARDELAGWIGAFDRYASGKGSDAPNWLSMYDAETVIIDRKTGEPRTIYVPSAAVSVVGTIQPGILARVFTPEHLDNGMLARVLLAMPPGKPALWSEAEISETVEQRFDSMVESLLALAPGLDDEGRPEPKFIGLDTSAKEVFIEWHDRHMQETADLTGELAAAFSKLKGVCARLALQIHCVRCVASDSTVNDPSRIDVSSVESAIVLTEWFKHEARRVYAALAEGDEGRERRRLVELIKRKGGSVTVRDWHRTRSHRTADDAEAELMTLKKAGLGDWEQTEPGPKGGRPTRVFRLCDTTDTDTTLENSGESEDVSVSEPSDSARNGWGEEGEL